MISAFGNPSGTPGASGYSNKSKSLIQKNLFNSTNSGGGLIRNFQHSEDSRIESSPSFSMSYVPQQRSNLNAGSNIFNPSTKGKENPPNFVS